MARYFTLNEFIRSDTAKRLGIDNTPTPEAKHHLLQLMDFLDDLRWGWTLHCDANELGSGKLRINSGYRCPELNKAVGGAETSAHLIGYAADIWPYNGQLDEFRQFLSNYLKDKQFDQCIDETSKKSRWIHLGLFNQKGEQRHQMFSLNV